MSGGPGSLQIEACVDCAILTESDHGQLRVRLTDARQFADGVRAANGSATADDADDADEGNDERPFNHGTHGRTRRGTAEANRRRHPQPRMTPITRMKATTNGHPTTRRARWGKRQPQTAIGRCSHPRHQRYPRFPCRCLCLRHSSGRRSTTEHAEERGKVRQRRTAHALFNRG